MNRAKNPVFAQLEKTSEETQIKTQSYGATYTGITIKTGILLLVTILSGGFAWYLLQNSMLETAAIILGVSGFVALFSVLIASFFPRVAMPFSILYTLAQGFTLGVLTLVVELAFPGMNLSLIAVFITIILFGVMLALYTSKTLRATSKFRKMMTVATISILIFMLLSAFIRPLNDLFVNNFMLAAALSIFFILYGAFMLVLNFDQAELVVEHGLPKNYEWTVSLGLMVTIIWIYVEVLRLLVILMQNRE